MSQIQNVLQSLRDRGTCRETLALFFFNVKKILHYSLFTVLNKEYFSEKKVFTLCDINYNSNKLDLCNVMVAINSHVFIFGGVHFNH